MFFPDWVIFSPHYSAATFFQISPVIKQEVAHENSTATFSLIRRRGSFGRVSVSFVVTGDQVSQHLGRI